MPAADASVRADLLQLFLAHWRSAMTALAVVTLAVFTVGRGYVDGVPWTAWGAAVLLNTGWQTLVCRRMERAASPAEAVARWLPRLLASLAVNGTLWGLLPFLVAGAGANAVTLACTFNAMLLFSVVTAPGTRGMVWAAAPPIGILGAAAIVQGGHAFAALGFLALVGMMAAFGLKLKSALARSLLLRRDAERLAAELREHQALLLESERQRTLLVERDRLTRDMHDGLGSALVASLLAVERGNVEPLQLGRMLRECVDDLRLVIASIEPEHRDLGALLAASRERLQRQARAAGVRFEWAVDDLPAIDWLRASESLHVLRIVQEAIANAVRHGQPNRVRLEVKRVGDTVEIVVEDDGAGFDPQAVRPGRGLPSLAARAASLTGTFTLDAAAGRGTRVRLAIPLYRKSGTDAGFISTP